MNEQFLQLGAVAIIFLFSIKEFFLWLKSRKKGNDGNYGRMIEELKKMNNNHLNGISKDINDGSEKVVSAITLMHTDLASRLGELKGKLDK